MYATVEAGRNHGLPNFVRFISLMTAHDRPVGSCCDGAANVWFCFFFIERRTHNDGGRAPLNYYRKKIKKEPKQSFLFSHVEGGVYARARARGMSGARATTLRFGRRNDTENVASAMGPASV